MMDGMRRRRPGRALAVLALVLLTGSGCGGDSGDDEPTVDSLPPETAPPASDMRYGDTCTEGSHEDCIDPDNDGTYTYLEGGAECMATFHDSQSLCSDLDEDGRAGYPDSG